MRRSLALLTLLGLGIALIRCNPLPDRSNDDAQRSDGGAEAIDPDPAGDPAQPVEPVEEAPAPEAPLPDSIEAERDPGLAHFLVDLSGYHAWDDASLSEIISGALGGGAGALEPEDVALLDAASEEGDSLIGCYARAGAFGDRVYVSQARLTHIGLVGVINQSRLADPGVLADCVLRPALGDALPFGTTADAEDVDPRDLKTCSHQYEMTWNEETYRIFYAGTAPLVCSDLCSALDGCPASLPAPERMGEEAPTG